MAAVLIPLLWWAGSWGLCAAHSLQRIERPQPEALAAVEPSAPQTMTATQYLAIMTDAKAWMFDRVSAARSVLEFSSDEQALEALRGLGELRGFAAANILRSVADDPTWPQALRIEAIQALGVMNVAESGSVLKELLTTVKDEELKEQIVTALGSQPWDSIGPEFEKLLEAPDSTSALRVAATEALARSTPEALPTLQGLVSGDADADVRAAAAWAMSCVRVDQPYGPQLIQLVRKEPEVMVRRRLYEALLVQADNAAADLANTIRAEQDISARVAGLNALGDSVGRSMDAKRMAAFDSQDLPELTRIAFSQETLNLRMRAVFAMRRAGTAAAIEALTQISKTHPAPQVARAALNGARAPTF